MESKALAPLLYTQLMVYGKIFLVWPSEGKVKKKKKEEFLRDLQGIC